MKAICYGSNRATSNSVVIYEEVHNIVANRVEKNAVICDVTPNDSCKNLHFGGTYRLRHQSDKNQRPMNNISSN
jgi:hypothetical protein